MWGLRKQLISAELKGWPLWQLKKLSCFGATSQTALPIQPILPIFAVNGMDWQCCLTCSSKMAPKIWNFSNALVADYSFELISTET